MIIIINIEIHPKMKIIQDLLKNKKKKKIIIIKKIIMIITLKL